MPYVETRLSLFVSLLVLPLLLVGCDQGNIPTESDPHSGPSAADASAQATGPQSFSGGNAVKGVKVKFDDVVEAGEIPPPEKGLATNLPPFLREVLKLQRTSRCVYGTLGKDADFQICLPVEGWNGKLAVWAPAGVGSELQGSLALEPAALNQGYAFATTDVGTSLIGLIEPQNRLFEGERRALQLTRYAAGLTGSFYDDGPVRRTYVAGHSYGAYLATRLLEQYPGTYDGGIRNAGANSFYQSLRAFAIWLRNFDKRDEDGNPLDIMYDVGAELPNGSEYRLGQERGTEELWAKEGAQSWFQILAGSLPGIDPKYDPDGDGSLSPQEIKSWDADERPPQVQARLKKTAVSGRMDKKMIAYSGLIDLLSPPSVDREYKRLVEQGRGSGKVQLYLEEGVGHTLKIPALNSEGNPVGFYSDALEALANWVEKDTEPGTITGLSPEK